MKNLALAFLLAAACSTSSPSPTPELPPLSPCENVALHLCVTMARCLEWSRSDTQACLIETFDACPAFHGITPEESTRCAAAFDRRDCDAELPDECASIAEPLEDAPVGRSL